MTPALPPSSRTTFFLPARSFIRQPTDGDPVNVSSLKRSSATIRSPSSRVIGRIDTEPAGTPAASMISATVSIMSGSLDGGLRTIGLPDAIAGASLCAARFSGKLNGLMAAIGPIGNRRVMPIRSFDERQQVERDDLAGHPLRLLGAEAEREDRPVDLDQRVADGLAGLEGDEPAELLAARLEPGADLAQDPAALVGRQLARDLEGGDRRLDRLLVLGLGGVEGAARRASRGRPGWSTTSGSGDSTQRPARKIGCGLAPATMAMGRVLRAGGGGVTGWYREGRARGAARRGTRRSPGGHAAFCDDTRMPDLRSRLAVEPGTQGASRGLRHLRHAWVRQAGRPKATAEQLDRLTDLQERIWAEAKRSVLVVLQGIDAAGKDGTINEVMEAFNPQGCPVTSFKVPTAEELAHDYLWRVHKAVPRKGEIGIFNRSHYEDVLVVRVHDLVPQGGLVEALRPDQRVRAARSPTTGTTIVKFFLSHLQGRAARALPGPLRRSRPSAGSSRWATSRSASAGTTTRPPSTTPSSKTSTAWAPWYVIPADRKWFRDVAVVDDPGRHDRRPASRPTPVAADLPADLVIE